MKALPSEQYLFLEVPKLSKIAPRKIKDQSPIATLLCALEREGVFPRILNDFALKMASVKSLSEKPKLIANLFAYSTG